MLLKGAIRLKKGPSRFLKTGSPWIFSNELRSIDTKLAPGSWVSVESYDGRTLGYGHFNPHSLIAFRAFERRPFENEELARSLFFTRLDNALLARTRAYAARFVSGELSSRSMRLCFGESDGLPGLVVDLYESSAGAQSSATRGLAVLQCHSAGADNFVPWTQQWLEKRMSINSGVIRNDLDVRRRENVTLGVAEWGVIPDQVFAVESGLRFFVDPRKGQKTGFFYDHRDNRAELARRAATMEGDILDCFSYVGSWGLQALKLNPKARLVALDVSASALEGLRRNAKANGLDSRVETVEADFFKDKQALGNRKFSVVVSDPPALTSSAKQAGEGRRAHEACFKNALERLAPGGIAAFASCSFHLSWDDFLGCVANAGATLDRHLKISFLGSQGADHPVLAALPETRYLKCVIAEELDGFPQVPACRAPNGEK